MAQKDKDTSSRNLTLRAVKIVRILRKATRHMPKPMVSTIIEEYGKDPFLILVSCLLSLRARDTVTLPVCRILFEMARTPAQLLQISIQDLEKIIYSLGFYKQKAKQLHYISNEILNKFNGSVSPAKNDLLSIKGIGSKTANLVLAQAFDIPAICVDTHVHRISNRLGLINTKTPLETELALMKILPEKYWSEWNGLLVMWGQNICVPISPFCSKCPLFDLCDKKNVIKRR